MQECKMAVDMEMLKLAYFTFDEPVPYQLNDTDCILIYPVDLKSSPLFLSCCDILTINKDEINSVEIIQMTYLQYLIEHVISGNEQEQRRLHIILNLCLKMEKPRITIDKKGKYCLLDGETGSIITAKNFEDIRRIIMYQNIYEYDDAYINPDLKKSIEETKMLRMNGIDLPNLERKMAIITSHAGISKKEQMEMTLRSHETLFQEVCGEIDFITTRPVALYGGQGDKVDHWIYRKQKGKFDDYLKPIESVKSQLGTGMVSN